MKRVFSSHDPMLAGYLRAVLEEHGIGCIVKNEYLLGGAGELPPTECWPELWVVEDGDEARARAIVEEARPAEAAGEGVALPGVRRMDRARVRGLLALRGRLAGRARGRPCLIGAPRCWACSGSGTRPPAFSGR